MNSGGLGVTVPGVRPRACQGSGFTGTVTESAGWSQSARLPGPAGPAASTGKSDSDGTKFKLRLGSVFQVNFERLKFSLPMQQKNHQDSLNVPAASLAAPTARQRRPTVTARVFPGRAQCVPAGRTPWDI
jgi:hypothetical protein